MSIKDELRVSRERFKLLSLYQRFEHIVILILTALIAVIVVAAVWEPDLADFVRPDSDRESRSVRLHDFPSRIRHDQLEFKPAPFAGLPLSDRTPAFNRSARAVTGVI
jgi:hypothetical protein